MMDHSESLSSLPLSRKLDQRSKWNILKTTAGLFALCTAMAVALSAQTFNTLLRFNGTDGERPYAQLVQGSDGNLYGTTSGDGTADYGNVFRITPQGELTTLHNFVGSDGYEPIAGLVQGMDGSFYGTTAQGGANNGGTVFKITSTGNLTTLYNFCAQADCFDGSVPFGTLVQGVDGNFYGTSLNGGEDENGTVFKITPAGEETTVYRFAGTPDGEYPYAGLVLGTDGNFYGTTWWGGAHDQGSVFKITPRGQETVLYSFCSQTNCADGNWPEAGLVQGGGGSFYGTTNQGGTLGYGTVFKITVAGELTTLYSFDISDGAFPMGALALGTDGAFYGITVQGGASDGSGTVFKISATGNLSVIHSFHGPDGAAPKIGR